MNNIDDKSIDCAPKNIPIEDILHYRAKGLSQTEIARLTGCTHGNISQRLRNANLESLQNYNKYKDHVLEHKQREIFNELQADKIKAMSGLQLITGVAILEDKIRTIRGQCVEITEQRVLKVDLDKAYQAMRQAGVEGTGQAQDVVEVQAPERGGGGGE